MDNEGTSSSIDELIVYLRGKGLHIADISKYIDKNITYVCTVLYNRGLK